MKEILVKKSDAISSIKKITAFFPSLNHEELEIVYQSSTELRVKKEQNIFVSGEKAYSLYLLTSGCVKFTREYENNKSIISSLAKEGDCFGIYEMFSKSPYFERTCTAITNCEYISVPNVAISGIGEKNSTVFLDFLKRICGHSFQLYNRIEGVRYKTAKQRLATCFLDIYPYFTNRDSSKKALLSRSDFADLSDMTPETVSRVFAELKKIGAVKGNISDFNIIDIHLLREISEEKNV
jgi:CRP/FNR family transcriptional regulator, anaerobic regulatory protein